MIETSTKTADRADLQPARVHCPAMSPQFVRPYVKTNKHDAADAEAICEAVRRPNMRFVGTTSRH